MFSKIKTLFSKQENPEVSPVDFKHPPTADADPQQCPFMKNKKAGAQNNPEAKSNQKNTSDTESQEEEKPRGGCPFMASSGKKKNPNLRIEHQGYDEPFTSQFKFYLSANKLNLHAIRKGSEPVNRKRQVFNTYPIYLQHTLFFNGEDYQKVRSFECCSRFLAYEELREKGNKFYNKGKYSKCLEYYERAMSLFRWLEYKEKKPITTELSLPAPEITSRSELSDEESMGSKVYLNLSDQNSKKGQQDQEDQFEKLTQQYKQFFVVYTDENVEHFNGEDLTEKADIDMRNSLLIQIYLNMAAAYIHLNNFSLALQAVEDGFKLSEKVSQLYLRKAQAICFDKSSDLEMLELAKVCIEKAIGMRGEEKIFQNTNKNILKMVNIHDAEQVYSETLGKINERIAKLTQSLAEHKLSIETRLACINRNEKQIIEQGKIPKESSHKELLSETSEYKIILRMYDKYVRVLDFYTQAKNKEQITLAKKEFQEVLRVISEITMIQAIKIQKNVQKFGDCDEKVFNRIKNIKRQHCEQIYNKGKYNYQVLEWAIKEIVQEEQEEEERLRKQEEQERAKNQETIPIVPTKPDLLSKLPYAMVLIPVLGLVANYLIL